MPDGNRESDLEKARAFFERAQEVAATDNFDYAIDLYLEGLRHAPEALEDGHAPLRRLALIRQGKGGKKPSLVDKMKHRGGKVPLEEMLNAEFLLAKDPDHLPHAEAMLTACVAGGYTRSAEWIARLIFDANRASDKPSLATYLLLKDAYAQMEMFSMAVNACQQAIELKVRDDGPLRDELRNLSAQLTMQKGKYDQDGDFRKSIKNRKKQESMHRSEDLVKSVDSRAKAVEDARKAVAEAPQSTANILKLVDVLVAQDTEPACQEALEVLEKAYVEKKDFALKRRWGQLKIRRLKSDMRAAKTALESDSEDEKLRSEYTTIAEAVVQAELEHYRLCVANYPTDLRMKYEYGLGLLNNKQYDDAIPLFQEAQKDPRYKVTAMDKTGLCFYLKQWFDDAIDIFTEALGACEVQDSAIAKDLRYNLAKSYEHKGQTQEALELYRKLAQLDFGYKDVRRRVDKLRNANGQK